MTRYDLRVAGFLLAIVVVLGLGIGYLVGTWTRADVRATPSDIGGAVAFVPNANDPGRKPGSQPWIPGYDNIYVNDYADLLDATSEAELTVKLQDLYRRSGVEMTVLTIDKMTEYNHSGAIEPFATQLFNTWGIGNAERNDGVLVLVSRKDRRMRIELGAGFDRTWDARMQKVIDWKFLTKFRQDQYQQGIVEGVDETIYQIQGDPREATPMGRVLRGWRSVLDVLTGTGWWLVAIAAVPLAVAGAAIELYWRSRPKRCERCSTLMKRLGETADDEHLDGGQQLEEFLNAIDYDVWECPGCGDMRIIRYRKWLSRSQACPSCKYHTMHSQSVTLQPATTSRSGRKRIDYDCRHCDYNNSELRSIPRLPKNNSRSGGGSFGGGSSSGGGASGSW